MKTPPAPSLSRHTPFSLLALLLLPLSAPLDAQYTLVWADEFDQPDGSAPDPANWNYDIGTGNNGWGNSEQQYYTDRTENARIEGGHLVIEARREDFGGRLYTSARLKTQGKQEWTYGKIEARIKVPDGLSGLWPAFWTLGANFGEVGWPLCGEIDIMEYVSRNPNEIFGTIHGPLYSGGASISQTYTFAGPVADDFHVFAVEWEPGMIRWYVDGVMYHSATPDTIGSTRAGPKEWVFDDSPHFLILNIAIGGIFGGTIDPGLQFPAQMQVDYVRVYSQYGMFSSFDWVDGWVDTGAFMGWVQLDHYPWVYVDSLGSYIYAAPSDSPEGWVYLPR